MSNPHSEPDFRNLALVIMIVMPLVLLYIQSLAAPQPTEISYSEFTAAIDRGEIRSVTIQGQTIAAERPGGGTITAYVPPGADLVPRCSARTLN